MMGNIRFQKLFEKLHLLSLDGMHIGAGASTEASGEAYVINYVHQKLKNISNITIFDVGANVGDYAILLSSVFNKNTQILCFEPSKKTYQKLLTNTKTLSNISYYNIGLGNEESKVELFSNADESGLASLYNRRLDHFGIDMNQVEDVDMTTVDSFCLKNGINRIHFLKMDVEGHELKVLQGAKNLLTSVDFIQFEFGGCNIDSRTFFQDFFYLLKDNFRIYRIVRNGIFEIKTYKEMYESFLTTNYLAERISI